jgi:hypothetical protein
MDICLVNDYNWHFMYLDLLLISIGLIFCQKQIIYIPLLSLLLSLTFVFTYIHNVILILQLFVILSEVLEFILEL